MDNNGKSSVVSDRGEIVGDESVVPELDDGETILEGKRGSVSCVGVKKSNCKFEEHCDRQDGQDLMFHVDEESSW